MRGIRRKPLPFPVFACFPSPITESCKGIRFCRSIPFLPLVATRPMHLTAHDRFSDLSPQAGRWNELALGVPFRRWEWLEAWWRCFGPQSDGGPTPHRSLRLLALWQGERLIAVAPWCIESEMAGGRVLRPMGGDQVCSDYLSVLCEPGQEHSAAECLADWLADQAHPRTAASQSSYDRLDFPGMPPSDPLLTRLVERLSSRGHAAYLRPGPTTWRVALPGDWETYLRGLSKSHRKQVRQCQRRLLASPGLVVRSAESPAQLAIGLKILIQLHQSRWQARGQPGCFASPPFANFHCQVAEPLWRERVLDLFWLELDGTPIAAEYQLLGQQGVFAYQSGLDPARLADQPGRLATIVALQRALANRRQFYDFLRGDEPYKAHWRAAPLRSLDLHIVPRRLSAQVRQGVRLAGDQLKQWLKHGLRRAGLL